jgi:multidrug resistance efflux pump
MDSRASVVAEDNSRRKFHRVNLAMNLEYLGKIYRVRDWSVGGVAIEGFDTSLQPDAIIEARIILPMPDSQIFVRVHLRICIHKGGVTGCEFYKPNPRQKRILRHYVEMAVEGRLQNVDDLIAITTAPMIESPIDEALTFSELEKNSIESEFRKKSIVTVSLAISFAIVMVIAIFYVTLFRIEKIGIAVGSLGSVSAGSAGRVADIYQDHLNAKVSRGTPLFAFDSSELDGEIAALQARIAQLNADAASQLQSVAGNQSLLGSLQSRVRSASRELEAGKALFQQQLIDRTSLAQLEDRLNDSRMAYERERVKSMGSVLAGSSGYDPIADEIARLGQDLERLQQSKEQRVVRAPEDGKLISVNYHMNQFLERQDVVALIEKDIAPFVSIRLLSDEAIKLSVGMDARIYAPVLGEYFDGVISDIGYAAFDTSSTLKDEVKQGETLVRIDFRDRAIRLPPNARVKVWIRTFHF